MFYTYEKDGLDYITECSIVENTSLWHLGNSYPTFKT